jgi:hypothetical protein
LAEVKLGTRLRSVVCHTEVILTKGSPHEGALSCSGQPMVPSEGAETAPAVPSGDIALDKTLLGKRYRTADGTIEVLCVHQGRGALAVGGLPLELVKPKLLPASD